MQKKKGNSIVCKHFGECGSCKLYALSYEEQISQKLESTKKLFDEFGITNIAVFKTNDIGFRNRCEFRIWHEDNKISYAMNSFDGQTTTIQECHIASFKIQSLMPKLLNILSLSPILSHKLFAVEFLSSNSHEDIVVTLIYHKKLDESWKETVEKYLNFPNVNIIGRSRKTKIVLQNDYIKERVQTDFGDFRYFIYEGSFSQPNGSMNEKMISWVLSNLKSKTKDLLELYCGAGNFTLPLSSKFAKVLATEISKTSIKAAKQNCELNDVTNIEFIRMSAEELTSALKKEREFVRLQDIDLQSYDFSHVFVDPPRAGLDEKSLEFISGFDNIIYISCNQETLQRDLKWLINSHKIVNFAIFDQFAHTHHIESGVILTKR